MMVFADVLRGDPAVPDSPGTGVSVSMKKDMLSKIKNEVLSCEALPNN
jgi:hypothetical protein